MSNSEHDPANRESGGPQPSEDEVWRDLVSRLENTESLPDRLEDTQPSEPDDSLPDPVRPADSPPAADQPPATNRPPETVQPPAAGQPPPSNHPNGNRSDQDRSDHDRPDESRPDESRPGGDLPGGVRPLGPRDYIPPEDDDGFVPEEPPSLAGAEPLVVLAWIGSIGGPLALLLSAFIFRSMPMVAVVGIVAVFIASVVFLLMRLPTDRGNDHDDGAVV
ncbi:hypothetical protein [Arthrobacter castelli]|uniref:hypothetical protein n=1 Tax=Arthrobacter castelli TaxID=271431 RepID=UPI00041594A3|nr:hypothetical protein [Arthrobacter castelli]